MALRAGAEIGETIGRPSSPIAPEQLAASPPEFRATLRAVIEHHERRIAELETELSRLKKTPRHSSLPPSSEHPHAKPPLPRPKSGNSAAAKWGMRSMSGR